MSVAGDDKFASRRISQILESMPDSAFVDYSWKVLSQRERRDAINKSKSPWELVGVPREVYMRYAEEYWITKPIEILENRKPVGTLEISPWHRVRGEQVAPGQGILDMRGTHVVGDIAIYSEILPTADA